MLKKLTLLAVLALSALVDFSFAQTITIGTGTATNGVTTASPVNIYFRRQVCQMVYTVAELNAAGITGASTINEIGFFVSNKPIYDIPGYTISLKHTNSTNAAGNLNGGYTTVVNSHTYSGVTGDWNMMTCDNPFAWNGTQNIAVQVCWSQVAPTWDPSGQVRVFNSTSGYRYRRNDNAGSACGTNPNQTLNTKPHIRFVFETETVWNGSVSTDWFNPANWSADVPNADMDARIPTGTPNNPTIVGLAECNLFTVEGTLNLNGSSRLNVYGDMIQNGTINDAGGTITFSGTGSNTLFNNTALELYTLNCESKGGVTFTGNPITIISSLGVQKSTLETNDLVTIRSNASGTGRIDELITNCFYSLTMNDTWGDGWNGGFLEVFEDGVSIGTYSATDASDTEVLSLGNGSTINFVYTAGSFENENSYIITDPGGSVVFNDGPNPSTGTVFTTVPSCTFTDPVTGTVTMERYIDAGETYWRYMSSAVQGSTVGDLNDDFVTSGYTGSHFPDFGWTSAYSYNEALPPGNGYVECNGVTDGILPGAGWQVWCGDTITGTEPFTFDFTGVPNQGDIVMPVTYTPSGTPTEDGWNLVGNPYASTIDWDAAAWTKTNMANAIYIQNPDNQQYATYVAGASTNGGSRYIASQQAFWVQAFAAAPVLTAREGVKSNVDQAFLKNSAEENPGLKITLQGVEEFDEAIIRHLDGAVDAFEYLVDAEKWYGGWGEYPQLSVMNNDSKDLTVHSFDNGNQELSIPIRAIVFENGVYHLNFDNLSSVNAACLILEDLYSGETYLIEEGGSYPFEMSDTTYAPRFLLHVGKDYESTVTKATCKGEADGQIALDLGLDEFVDYQLISNGVTEDLNDFANPLIISDLESGIYTIEVATLSNVCNLTTFNFVVGEPSPLTVDAEVTEEMNGYDGEITVEVTGGTAPYNFYWENGSNASEINGLTSGSYNLQIEDDNGCELQATIVVDSQLGLEDVNSDFNMVYLQSINSVQIQNWSGEQEELYLFDLNGRKTGTYQLNSSSQIIPIQSGLSQGVYMFGNANHSIKILITN
ncbi:MAG: SprB repeat-containing protein [Crocinitomicaceae bacterium]